MVTVFFASSNAIAPAGFPGGRARRWCRIVRARISVQARARGYMQCVPQRAQPGALPGCSAQALNTSQHMVRAEGGAPLKPRTGLVQGRAERCLLGASALRAWRLQGCWSSAQAASISELHGHPQLACLVVPGAGTGECKLCRPMRVQEASYYLVSHATARERIPHAHHVCWLRRARARIWLMGEIKHEWEAQASHRIIAFTEETKAGGD